MSSIEIRAAVPDDDPAIEALYPAAFPDEDLLPLVRNLTHSDAGVLTLVARIGGTLSGHVMFTPCAVEGSDDRPALLGPLAVTPAAQRRGIGTALVSTGLHQLAEAAFTRVLVLGDPDYYGRFGFAREDLTRPPYPLPEAWRSAWQSLPLGPATLSPQGILKVHTPWQDPALWAP